MITNNKTTDRRRNNMRNPKPSGARSTRSSYAGMSRKPNSRPPIRNRKNAGLKFETKISEGTELAHIPPLASDSIRIINLGGVE